MSEYVQALTQIQSLWAILIHVMHELYSKKLKKRKSGRWKKIYDNRLLLI